MLIFLLRLIGTVFLFGVFSIIPASYLSAKDLSAKEMRYFKALDLLCATKDAAFVKDYDQAVSLGLESIANLDTVPSSIALAEAELEVSTAYFKLGDNAAFLDFIARAYRHSQSAVPEGGLQLSRILTNYGTYYYTVGHDVRKSRHYLELALLENMKSPDESPKDFSRTLISLATSCRYMGDLTRAKELLSQALLIREREFGPHSEEAVSTLLSMGNVYFDGEQYKEAKQKFEEAILAASRAKPPLMKRIMDLKNNLAVSMVELGEYQPAFDLYQEMRAYYSRPAELNTRRVTTAMQNTALVLVRMKRMEEAYAAFIQLLDFAKENGASKAEQAEIESDFAFYFSENNFLDSAMRHLQIAVHLLDSNVSTDDIYENPSFGFVRERFELFIPLMFKGEVFAELYLNGRGGRRSAEAGLNSFDLAIALLDERWLDIEDPGDKLYVNASGVNMYAQALTVCYSLWQSGKDEHSLNRALNYMERGKSQLMLESMRRARAAFLTGIPTHIHEAADSLRRSVIALGSRLKANLANPDSSNRLHHELMHARIEQEKLKQGVAEQYPAYSEMIEQRTPVTLDILRRRFSHPSELFVEYFLSDSALFVLSVRNGKANFRRSILGKDFSVKYERFLATMRRARKSAEDIREYEKDGIDLFEELLGPELAGAPEVDRIRIVPDGPFSSFPFDALPVSRREDATEFGELDLAVKRYLISYFGSASLMMDFAKTSLAVHPSECLGLAWSQGAGASGENRFIMPGKEWPNIPGTADELKAIHRRVFGKYLMGAEASEAAFKDLAGSYGVIHLALHGSAGEEEPILAFPSPGKNEDGILYLEELYSLPLRARLTVLSACETGLGRMQAGEGVMSMARGFGIAGCPSVVMSLWEVDDRSSSQIMEEFYQGLSRGLEIDVALRRAKLDYLNSPEGKSSAPFYWASFIPVGNTDPVVLQRTDATWPFAVGLFSAALLLAAVFVIHHRPAKKLHSEHPLQSNITTNTKSFKTV